MLEKFAIAVKDAEIVHFQSECTNRLIKLNADIYFWYHTNGPLSLFHLLKLIV